MQRTPTKYPTKHTAKCPHSHTKHLTNTPQGVGADSSCPYPYITKYAFSHYQIHIFISSHTHFRSSFCGCFHICGHDKSAPTAADGLPITLRTHHETPTNIPQGVGADSSCPYPYITKYAYSLHRICVFTLLNIYINFIAHAFSFLILWVHSYMRAR